MLKDMIKLKDTKLWTEGYQMLDNAPDTKRPYFVIATQRILAQLRAKIGEVEPSFRLDRLIRLYNENNDWCMDLLKKTNNLPQWAMRLSIVEDSAYFLAWKELLGEEIPEWAKTM